MTITVTDGMVAAVRDGRMKKTVITSISVGVEGFAPSPDGSFTLALRWSEQVISLPLSRDAMKKLHPGFGDMLLIDLCIPSEEVQA
jgi:hypothetical protein